MSKVIPVPPKGKKKIPPPKPQFALQIIEKIAVDEPEQERP
jgi:hypothetical protein